MRDYKFQTDFDNNTDSIIINKSKLNIVSDETDEIELFGNLNYSKVTDKSARYIIMTFSGIQEYVNLSKKAQRLLVDLICNYIKIDSNWFTFKQSEYARDFKVDVAIINKAIKELIEHNFISPVKENGRTTKDFIINHNYFFKGNIVAYKLWLKNKSNVQ